MWVLRWMALGSALGLLLAGVAAGELRVPALRAAVNDEAGMLAAPTRERLENALRALHQQGGTQLAVLTVPDLGGETIEQASIRVSDAWQLGDEKRDDGVLLLIAAAEREIRIEVGQGLEGDLTDAHAKRIIAESMVPLFRAGDVDGGVTVGVYEIARRTDPDVDLRPYLEGALRVRHPAAPRTRGAGPAMLLFVLIAVAAMRVGGFGGYGYPRGRHGYHWGGTGGFRGGGGFGGFSGGGGGFSGGGASGGW